jgi:hypothetical protein
VFVASIGVRGAPRLATSLRRKITPPFETQLDVRNVGPGNLDPSCEAAVLRTTGGYHFIYARWNRYAIEPVRVDHPTTGGRLTPI